MRENTKWIMLVTALAFVGLMIFEWGMDMSGQSGAQLTGGEVGSIDGEGVTAVEYNRYYRQLYDQRSQASNEPITPAENREIEERAWEELVTDRLLQRETSRLKLGATDEEILQAARYAPPPTFTSNVMFQTDGQFDFEKYHAFLSSPMTDPAMLRELETYYRDIIPRNRLFQRVASGIYVPDSELWRMYKDRTETATIRYLILEPARIVPDAAVSVTDAEIENWYRDHQDDLMQSARAHVRFVTIDAGLTAEDSAAALERARALRGQIVGGADFAEIARGESADPASASRGGLIGTFRRDQQGVPESINDVIWSIAPNQVSEPVLSPFGYHLLRVGERTDSTAQVSQVLVPIEMMREREDLLLSTADSLEDLAERYSLDRAAQDLGLQVREASITEDEAFVPGVGSLEEVAIWAFEEAEAEGEVSPLLEAGDLFMVAELVGRSPEQVAPLDEVRAQIRLNLIAEKKLERARITARDMVDRIRQGGSLEQAASSAGLQVQQAGPFTRIDLVPGIGRANAVVGAAFGLQPGQTSGVIEANDALYIVQLVSKTEADRQEWEAQKMQQSQSITSALEEARIRQYLAELREKAEVVDQRREAARAAEQAAAAAPRGPLGF